MAKTYHTLATVNLKEDSDYFHSGELAEILDIEDSAIAAMTDFKQTRAITIDKEAPLVDARIEMKACNVHMLLVTDIANQIAGLISSQDILGEKPVKIAQEKQIDRADIKVKMVMVPQKELLAIPFSELEIAKVGHVIHTLLEHKQRYMLVVDQDDAGTQTVRGLFSLMQISKQLDTTVMGDLHARTLAELQRRFN